MKNRIELDGIWKYKIDTEGTMLFHSMAEDFSWKNMALPQNWYKAGWETNGGVAWFRRRFTVPAEAAGRRLILTFTGVDYSATVWVNTSKAGEHRGYFQTFDFDITPYVVIGRENVITVRVEAPYEEPHVVWPANKKAIKGVLNYHQARPGGYNPEHGQEKNTGGIWNSVFIVLKEQLFVKGIKISPLLLKNGQALVDIRCLLENTMSSPQSVEVKIVISGANFEPTETMTIVRQVILKPQAQSIRFVQTVSHPHLWWCWDHGPQHLYLLTAWLEQDGKILDEHTRRFGIRQIEVTSQHEWYLNGRKIFIRGTNLVPTQWLSEYSRAAIQQDLALVKGAHLNALRLQAHVNREEFYTACDEAGILVYQDFALSGEYEDSDAFREEASRQLQEMIDLLHHHPSIAVWCCHHEPGSQAETLDALLFRVACEADATRHVVAASLPHEHSSPGWFGGNYMEFITLPGGPFPTEFGAQALPARTTLEQMMPASALWPPEWKRWEYHNFQHFQTFHTAKIEPGHTLDTFIQNSQEYQYNYIKFAIETYRCARFNPINGFFHFMLVDSWPAITWSVVDYYRHPKKGYRALQLACQPVLVHIHVAQRELLLGAGAYCFTALTIINDFPQSFADASLKIWLEDQHGQEVITEVYTITVQDNSLEAIPAQEKWILKEQVGAGVYMIRVKLITSAGALLSENEEKIHLVQRN